MKLDASNSRKVGKLTGTWTLTTISRTVVSEEIQREIKHPERSLRGNSKPKVTRFSTSCSKRDVFTTDVYIKKKDSNNQAKFIPQGTK